MMLEGERNHQYLCQVPCCKVSLEQDAHDHHETYAWHCSAATASALPPELPPTDLSVEF